MSEAVLYGIETCDQVRTARQWLRRNGVDARFHDFRRDGLTEPLLARWLAHVPWDTLLNRRGLAWRKLDPTRRAAIVDRASAVDALLADPTLVRRPVLEAGDHLLVGFSEPAYRATFHANE